MITNADFFILDFIQTHLMHPFLTVFLRFFTQIGDNGMLWIAIGIGLLCFPKTRKIGTGLLVCLMLEHTLCSLLLKPLVARPRPFIQNPDVTLLIPKLRSFSFPSGHSASSFCGALYLWGWNKKWGIPAVITAVLIAASRLYFYVHFPSDVLCGAVIGSLIGFLGARAFHKPL